MISVNSTNQSYSTFVHVGQKGKTGTTLKEKQNIIWQDIASNAGTQTKKIQRFPGHCRQIKMSSPILFSSYKHDNSNYGADEEILIFPRSFNIIFTQSQLGNAFLVDHNEMKSPIRLHLE